MALEEAYFIDQLDSKEKDDRQEFDLDEDIKKLEENFKLDYWEDQIAFDILLALNQKYNIEQLKKKKNALYI